MFRDKSSSAIVAVRDVSRAREFYEGTLGLEVTESMGDVLVLRTGDTSLVVYRSDEAGTNRANAVVWSVGDDIEAITAELAGKGVSFERYEMDGVTFESGIHRAGDFRMVWFKDPDGNILHLNSEG
ncbi:MAG: VOC family protein [Rhizobiaceae bacterium]|nr:VOC family protein [Rhizobiaceae bacterium]